MTRGRFVCITQTETFETCEFNGAKSILDISLKYFCDKK